MRGKLSPAWTVFTLFAITLGGIGILLFVASVPADHFNPAHDNLIAIGDWMVKVSIGAILGLGGARLTAARRNYGPDSPQ